MRSTEAAVKLSLMIEGAGIRRELKITGPKPASQSLNRFSFRMLIVHWLTDSSDEPPKAQCVRYGQVG